MRSVNGGGTSSGGIFISYRREETADLAGRLYDRLIDRFGEDLVFMDVDAIEPGVDFTEVITRAVNTCDVLLAIIGPQWLTVTGTGGRPRLDDPDDIVRLEIELALQRGIRVVPILVRAMTMPRGEELPESLRVLARRHAVAVRHESFRQDTDQLLTALSRIVLAEADQPAPPDRPARKPSAAVAVDELTTSDVDVRVDPPRTLSGGPRPRAMALDVDGPWELDHTASSGGLSEFRLHRGDRSYLIAVDLRLGRETIRVGEEVAVSDINVAMKTHDLPSLADELGVPVSIRVERGVWATLRLRELTMLVGKQVLIFRSGIR
jgi:hypothetical protein